MCAIIALLLILVFCYRQTIDAYPQGGGAYIVGADNLGEAPGLTAASSLLVGYILTVAVSSCSGAAAVASAFPELAAYKPWIAFVIVCILTWGNLRGMRESAIMFGVPTYFFIFAILALIVTGFVRVLVFWGTQPPEPTAVIETAGDVTVFLILRAFASGCTALTGVEAVSNGVPSFRDPSAKNAKKSPRPYGAHGRRDLYKRGRVDGYLSHRPAGGRHRHCKPCFRSVRQRQRVLLRVPDSDGRYPFTGGEHRLCRDAAAAGDGRARRVYAPPLHPARRG